MPLPAPVHSAKPYAYFKGGHNVRTIVIDDPIKDLCASLVAHGFLQSVGGIDKGEYGEPLYGFRRLAAYGYGLSQNLALPETIPVQLYPPSTTTTQRRIITATENLQRVDLSDPEIFRLCKELLELNPGWQQKDLAIHLNKHPSTITHYLSPDRLVPEALQAFLDGTFGLSIAYVIANSPDQLTALALKRNGATRDQLQSHSRKNGSVDGTIQHAHPAVRLPSIKIPLANDVATGTVTVTGEAIDLDDAETILKEAIKAIRTAKADNLDSKTAQAVWRNRAKAGL